MRISRPCYDKYNRCPGWNGGGLRFAKVKRCENGSLPPIFERRLWKWRLNKCPKCGVIVLPYNIRWIDWRWLLSEITRIPRYIESWRYERAYRRARKEGR